jgi:hypothetical protein
VVDALAVLGEDALVGRVARLELAGLLAGGGVELVDLVGRRVRDEQLAAVRRGRHVVGALALHREAPDDLAAGDVDAHDVGEARPGDVDEAPVGRRVHVVGVLVVALAHRLADGEEEREALGVAADLGQALLAIGREIDARQALVGARIDDVRGPRPVVPDEHDALGVGALGRTVAGDGESGDEDGREQAEADDERTHPYNVSSIASDGRRPAAGGESGGGGPFCP